MNNYDIFKSSGFEILKELEEAANATFDCWAKINQKIFDQSEKAAVAASVVERLRAEANVVIAAGKDDADIQADLREMTETKIEAIRMAEQFTELIHDAEKTANAAAATLFEHIRQRLEDATARRTSQLERARFERNKSLKRSKNGKVWSTPPGKSASACLGFCEFCGEPIAIFDPESIRQPVTAEHFKSCDAFESFPTFTPGIDMQNFKCPICNQRPWPEEDRILATDGYFLVPERVDDNQRKAS
jgi:hypothetical protein